MSRNTTIEASAYFIAAWQWASTFAAETVLSMKEVYSDITLVVAMPYRRQCEKFTPYNKQRYHNILAKADKVVILKENYADGCFLRRNDYMLSCSGRLIAYFDGVPKGGTYYTFKRAKQQAARYAGCQSVLINEMVLCMTAQSLFLLVSTFITHSLFYFPLQERLPFHFYPKWLLL